MRIHLSAWKRNPAKLAYWRFSAPLCQAALLIGACKSATRLLNTSSETPCGPVGRELAGHPAGEEVPKEPVQAV
jgi:hypothetical protein